MYTAIKRTESAGQFDFSQIGNAECALSEYALNFVVVGLSVQDITYFQAIHMGHLRWVNQKNVQSRL